MIAGHDVTADFYWGARLSRAATIPLDEELHGDPRRAVHHAEDARRLRPEH